MADNTTYTKATFKSVVESEKGGHTVKQRNGYEFTAFAIGGKTYKMYVYHDEDGNWRVVDPMTGQRLATGETRAKAVEEATTPTMVRNFSNLIKLDKYTDMVNRFIDLCGGKDYTIAAVKDDEVTVIAEVEHHELPEKPKSTKAKSTKPKAPKAPAKPKASAPKATKKSAPKKKAPAKESNELLDRIKKLEAELAELKAVKPTPEKVEVAATELTIDSVRKWAVPRGFVADQVNPERKDCIWVYGVRKDDKETQKELVGMGFRWGKKGWYIDPKRAR
jgi:hypothetical protein